MDKPSAALPQAGAPVTPARPAGVVTAPLRKPAPVFRQRTLTQNMARKLEIHGAEPDEVADFERAHRDATELMRAAMRLYRVYVPKSVKGTAGRKRNPEAALRQLPRLFEAAGWQAEVKRAEPDDTSGAPCTVFTLPWVPDASVSFEYGSAFVNFRDAFGYHFELKRLHTNPGGGWADHIGAKSWGTPTKVEFIEELEQLVPPELAARLP